MQLRRLIATTEYDNAASQAVMRKLGMRLVHNPNPEPAWFQVVGCLDQP
jgi:RimJ/RimL family protein N-acetyltransferase